MKNRPTSDPQKNQPDNNDNWSNEKKKIMHGILIATLLFNKFIMKKES